MERYHPRNKRNEILDPTEKQALLQWGKFLTLGLCSQDVPYVVTLSYGYDLANNCLYLHGSNDGEKLDFIQRNPAVCATLIKDNGYLPTKCSHAYESLIIRGTLRIISGLPDKKHGFQVILNHLESDPQPILARSITSDRSYDVVTILKLEIESIIGKRNVG